MDYEYRAVEWTSHDPLYDKVFMSRRAQLIGEGWEEHIRASWRPSLTGGACIMRRPKDEPRKDETPGRAEWHRLYREFYGVEPPSCFFLPRLDDEPRMWTKGEIEEISLAYHNLQLERLTMELNAKTDKEETNG